MSEPGPRVLVVDHADSYTWSLVHLLAQQTGELPTVVQHTEVVLDALPDFSHIVLSPGPGHPANPSDFALGDGVFAVGRPVLGVCLGMQALVCAFGGLVEVVEPAHGEVCAVTHAGEGAFAGLPSPFDAVRYHSLAATRVPSDLVETAWGDGVVMGVAHRDLPLWGVQFHPESILTEHGAQLVANFLDLR